MHAFYLSTSNGSILPLRHRNIPSTTKNSSKEYGLSTTYTYSCAAKATTMYTQLMLAAQSKRNNEITKIKNTDHRCIRHEIQLLSRQQEQMFSSRSKTLANPRKAAENPRATSNSAVGQTELTPSATSRAWAQKPKQLPHQHDQTPRDPRYLPPPRHIPHHGQHEHPHHLLPRRTSTMPSSNIMCTV